MIRFGRALVRPVRPVLRLYRAGGARRAVLLNGLALLAAIAVWGIQFGTSPTVYDVTRTGWGLMPIVAAIVAVPVAIMLVQPVTALVVSVAAAFLLGVLLPLEPARGIVWSWSVIHGLVMFALLFAVCVRGRWRPALGAWLLVAALFAWGAAPATRTGWIVGVTLIAVIGLLAGRLVGTRRALRRQEEVSEAEKAQRVVLEERTRIARDLHDIVAHHMSLVVVQAESAQYRVPGLPAAAVEELTSISETARSALAETRALLNVLRQDSAVATAPQPGLEGLPDLVDAARRAGVEVDADLDGLPPAGLGQGVSMACYRIVQEALANATRHAPGVPVEVRGATEDGELRLRVTNGPAGVPPGPAGHGITGMRERAAAVGARLLVGPTSDGGFSVDLALDL